MEMEFRLKRCGVKFIFEFVIRANSGLITKFLSEEYKTKETARKAIQGFKQKFYNVETIDKTKKEQP